MVAAAGMNNLTCENVPGCGYSDKPVSIFKYLFIK